MISRTDASADRFVANLILELTIFPEKVEGQLKVVVEEKCCEAQASVTYAVLNIQQNNISDLFYVFPIFHEMEK